MTESLIDYHSSAGIIVLKTCSKNEKEVKGTLLFSRQSPHLLIKLHFALTGQDYTTTIPAFSACLSE